MSSTHKAHIMTQKEPFSSASQKDKIDIIIALIVILFFGLLFWWLFPKAGDKVFLQNNKLKVEENRSQEVLAKPKEDKSEDANLFKDFSIGSSLIPDANLDIASPLKIERTDRKKSLKDFKWSSWFGFADREKDTDEDGISDKEDRCPDEFGVLANQGCPSDTDQDGVWDSIDKCPNEVGLAENSGCPEIIVEKYKPTEDEAKILDTALKNVQFRLASSEILASSYSALDHVAEILQKHPELNLEIEGHTDNEDSEEINNVLSAERALSCKNYIVALGIEATRISTIGYGESRPIADNSSKEGRAKNRRVEFNLSKAAK